MQTCDNLDATFQKLYSDPPTKEQLREGWLITMSYRREALDEINRMIEASPDFRTLLTVVAKRDRIYALEAYAMQMMKIVSTVPDNLTIWDRLFSRWRPS